MSRGIEATLQDKLVAFLKKNDIQYYKTMGGSYWLPYFKNGTRDFMCVKSQKGWPDIIVFFDKRLLLIELKKDDGRLRPEQTERFTKLKDCGYEVLILRPKHWENCKSKGKLSLKKLLEEMERF